MILLLFVFPKLAGTVCLFAMQDYIFSMALNIEKKRKKLYLAILESGYSLQEFADKIDISYRALNLIVNRRTTPRAETRKRIASALGKPQKDLDLR
jgi:predicted transcriptional regulator